MNSHGFIIDCGDLGPSISNVDVGNREIRFSQYNLISDNSCIYNSSLPTEGRYN
jgi:hypothetical protein